VRIEVIKAVNMMNVFWDMTLCNLLGITEISVEYSASVFRIEKYDDSGNEYR
jgi:hypothetical protein